MQITVKTKYSKEKLLKFNNYIVAHKWMQNILMILGTLLIAALHVVFAIRGVSSQTLAVCTVLIVFFDLAYLICYIILPMFTVKRAKNLNTVIQYVFYEGCFDIGVKDSFTERPSRISYTKLTKVAFHKGDLYLFFSPNHGYIVDTTSMKRDDSIALRDALMSKLPKSKVNFPI